MANSKLLSRGAMFFVFVLLSPQVWSSGLYDQPVKAGLDESWIESARLDLASREYSARESEIGLQAPNRAQAFRTIYKNNSLHIVELNNSKRSIAEIQTIGFGSQGPVGSAHHPATNEFESGALLMQRAVFRERTINDNLGLHLEWLLERAPTEGGGKVWMELKVAASTPTSQDGDVILHGQSRALRLHKMIVHDGDGKEVEANLHIAGDRLQISIEGTEANYPLTIKSYIDGLVDTYIQSDQQNSEFGLSVAGAGDLNADGFDDVIVGAPGYDAGLGYTGAAFVYFGDASGIDALADAYMLGTQQQSRFGASVAGVGDFNGDGIDDVIVGAPAYNNQLLYPGSGAAFVFLGNEDFSGLRPIAGAIQLQVREQNVGLGGILAAAGDVNGDGYSDIVAAVPGLWHGGTSPDYGAALIYCGNDQLDGEVDSDIRLPNRPENIYGDDFASSVSGAGDVNGDGYDDIVVGASGFDIDPFASPALPARGAAFVYFGGAGDFNTEADAVLTLGQGQGLGFSVGGAGDANGDGFGDIVVASGDYVIVTGNYPNVAVWYGGGGPFDTVYDVLFTYEDINWIAGSWARGAGSPFVTGAGDVNGDGMDDVVDPAEIGGAFPLAYIFFGGADGLETTAGRRLHCASSSDGGSTSRVGDINGDGYSDVVIGNVVGNNNSAGVYLGGPSSLDFLFSSGFE
jgi:hypothetical protein